MNWNGRKRLTAVCLVLAAVLLVSPEARSDDLQGEWNVTLATSEGSTSAVLQLKRSGENYEGLSGPLDIVAACPVRFTGTVMNGQLRLTAICRDNKVGELLVSGHDGLLSGNGTLFGGSVTVSGNRPVAETPQIPRTLDYNPVTFHPITSSTIKPVLRIRSGDRVRTRTVDTYGLDERSAVASMPGNAGTGPFYVEGAMPGDTVAIRFISIKTNRSTARMKTAIDPGAVMPGHVQASGAVTDVVWMLDTATNTAALRTPSTRLKRFVVPLRPMLGTVAIAPEGFSVPNRELGEWGGNLDYNEIRAGTTLYLPVYNAGGLIFMGDGHALQGDGEITGQGLETSLDVEFEVTLVKRQAFPRPPGFPPLGPWAENNEFVMISGIGGDVTDALRRATTGLSLWLKRSYELDDSEVAAVLGTSVEYDVAEVISAKSHVVAKIRKDVLAKIAPATP